MKVFTRILLILGIILAIAGIGYVGYGFYLKATTNISNPVATMEVEDYGTIKIELYPDKAPNTVANFIRLANRGFYNGLTFHRTIPGFMIQGGDKTGSGSGSPSLSDIQDNVSADKEYNIPGEFIANGYAKNNLKHTAGIISMARTDYSQYNSALTTYGYNSAGSQFFIMTNDNTQLDGLYAAFGKVLEGMDVVEKIASTEVTYRNSELKEGETAPKDEDGNTIASDRPKKLPVIKSISVETYGVDYGMPETLDVFDYYTWLMQQYGMSAQ
ncbi:MAG: peptidylprolyl isomerase [Clostridia bacterium]|nr:peptidylprolyl isomerase [Clostridia bacterium]